MKLIDTVGMLNQQGGFFFTCRLARQELKGTTWSAHSVLLVMRSAIGLSVKEKRRVHQVKDCPSSDTPTAFPPKLHSNVGKRKETPQFSDGSYIDEGDYPGCNFSQQFPSFLNHPISATGEGEFPSPNNLIVLIVKGRSLFPGSIACLYKTVP